MTRPSTSARGYGAVHQSVRRQLSPLVASGAVRCARCGQPILAGEPWDLGHSADRTHYRGAEHRRCNRATATHRAASEAGPPTPEIKVRHSRVW